MRIPVACIALSTFLLAAAQDAFAQGSQSVPLAVGSGARQIGLLNRPNEECRGPVAIAPAAAGRLAVLDGINRKVVLVGGEPLEDVPLPSDLVEPSDLVSGSSGFAVLGSLGDLVVISARGQVVERARVNHNPEQGAVRLVIVDGVFYVEDIRGQRVSTGVATTRIGGVLVPGIATAAGYVRQEASPNLVVLRNRELNGPLESISITPRVGARIVEVRAVWAEPAQGALVAIQERGGASGNSNFVRLVIMDSQGVAREEAFLGPESFSCNVRRPFTRLTDGRIASLILRGRNQLALDVVSFSALGSRVPKAVSQGDEAITLVADELDELKRLETLNGTSAVTAISLSSIARTRVVERARAALELNWKLSAINYSRANVPNECQPPQRVWKRPQRLDGMLNKQVKAVPYRWGGYVRTLDGFLTQLSEGRLAGDVCTCRVGNCVFRDATGLDCSGFVSYAWDTGTYFTTASLPSERVSSPLRWEELGPADIVNKAGSHVRLVESVESNGTNRIVRVIESATSETCGGVCRRDYTESELQSSGYKPYRRAALEIK